LLTVIYQFQEKIQEAQFASSTQLTAYYRETEEELLKEKEVVEEKKGNSMQDYSGINLYFI
jgi:hypothetical protein